jgi:hypothetical protein
MKRQMNPIVVIAVIAVVAVIAALLFWKKANPPKLTRLPGGQLITQDGTVVQEEGKGRQGERQRGRRNVQSPY